MRPIRQFVLTNFYTLQLILNIANRMIIICIQSPIVVIMKNYFESGHLFLTYIILEIGQNSTFHPHSFSKLDQTCFSVLATIKVQGVINKFRKNI